MKDTTKQVRAAIAYGKSTATAVAEYMGVTPPALSQRLTAGTLRPADLEKVADAIGAEYISIFRFPDGTEI